MPQAVILQYGLHQRFGGEPHIGRLYGKIVGPLRAEFARKSGPRYSGEGPATDCGRALFLLPGLSPQSKRCAEGGVAKYPRMRLGFISRASATRPRSLSS